MHPCGGLRLPHTGAPAPRPVRVRRGYVPAHHGPAHRVRGGREDQQAELPEARPADLHICRGRHAGEHGVHSVPAPQGIKRAQSCDHDPAEGVIDLRGAHFEHRSHRGAQRAEQHGHERQGHHLRPYLRRVASQRRRGHRTLPDPRALPGRISRRRQRGRLGRLRALRSGRTGIRRSWDPRWRLRNNLLLHDARVSDPHGGGHHVLLLVVHAVLRLRHGGVVRHSGDRGQRLRDGPVRYWAEERRGRRWWQQREQRRRRDRFPGERITQRWNQREGEAWPAAAVPYHLRLQRTPLSQGRQPRPLRHRDLRNTDGDGHLCLPGPVPVQPKVSLERLPHTHLHLRHGSGAHHHDPAVQPDRQHLQ
mmetsp:Transcript_16130/g.35103  ORF Transcript_16130/g.35103 Transcript_16130/m.35103 type:complete len:363 (+) Transcript_16130:1375-2463(+)